MQDNLFVNYIFRQDTKKIPLNSVVENTIIFTFREFEPIAIVLESDNYEVELECISYKLNDSYYSCDNNVLSLEKGMKYSISINNDVDVYYYPAKYQISIKKGEKITKCFFEVLYNSQVTEQGMSGIIEKINKFINGLSIDFFSKSKINNIKVQDSNSDYFIYELINNLQWKITMSCEKIINNLRNSLNPKIINNVVEKKQNLKTIKMNILKKDNGYYNNIKVIDYSTPENIILKRYLSKLIKIFDALEKNIDQFILEKESRYLGIRSLIINIQNDNINKSQFDKKNTISRIKSLESEAAELKNWIAKLTEWKLAYYKVVSSMNKLYFCDEMSNINIDNQIIFSTSFIMNPYYKVFKDLYDQIVLNNNNNQHMKNKIGLFADRKSYNIFEIYGFILIQNILKEEGYELVSKELDVFSFSSDSTFIFKRNNDKIEVNYDHFCIKYQNSKNDQVVNINSRNCKPDYIIKKYENGELKDIIIIEIKYRNLKYMVDYHGGTTETDATLDDYAQLAYRDTTGRILRDKVKVLLLYPSKSEKIFTRNMGKYIGINIDKDFIESKGYNELVNEIFPL